VQPKGLTKEEKPIEIEWIDEGQCVCLDKVEAVKKEVVGGPASVPSKISHP